MAFTKFLTATAAFALAASALPTNTSPIAARSSGSSSGGGGVNIVNNLGQTVYLWPTADGEMQTLSSGGDGYSQSWNGESVSIKLSTSESKDSVLQFEYSLKGEDIYWDLSSINLDSDSAFVKSGFGVTSSDSSCKSASCSAGDSNCADSYQHPDDTNTNSCSSDATFTFTLG
ncbi:hypothetical protein ASPWEDRAFT_45699 [Aspergillus wentii DTO 134E9]|uniref:Uncharacterized protein n=1 Tax=Aspergillus wentii DTO 134E9 TaxID=1073089 RepID=A0A1L9R5C5_ASPWE|nr:uncharacterized protein ASPWEDRAFT_45699 [Aspergillus wentii DTO 134E9]KAI9923763.1 hypothetical protein MW887_008391 [Aspergillus wentii]OJJ30121.1 hypothetical protein ASPWEDRAFT_45699 [Aspergillus wentii DTO 134E9]